MPGLIYAQDHDDAVYVNLYVSSESSFDVRGRPLGLSITSGMPWDGSSALRVASRDEVRATIKRRIPGGARNQPVPGAPYRDGARGVLAVSGGGWGGKERWRGDSGERRTCRRSSRRRRLRVARSHLEGG